jgi:type IV pilus assembly protein PilP
VRVLAFVLFVASATAIVGAQSTAASTPPPAAAGPATAAPAPDTAPKPLTPESYSYDPAGRRDPFTNLLGGGNNGPASRKGEGPSGIAVAELSVRGVMQSRSGLIAMVQGPDNKTYIVHQGDKLLDGSIKTITAQGLIIEQDVNDPLSVVKQREVRRLLRGLEDPK